MPTIRVPLAAPDHEIDLELGVVYATAHERGRYARSIDSKAALDVPLARDDKAWAEAQAGATER